MSIPEVIACAALFGLLHSACVTEQAKSAVAALTGELFVRVCYRFVFTLLSILLTAALAWFIDRLPDKTLLIIPAPIKYFFYFLQGLGLYVGLQTFRVIDGMEFLGLRQIIYYLRGRQAGTDTDSEGVSSNLIITGMYSKVRHPLYLAGILIFTFNPHITANWLTVTVLADIYFLLGAILEEKRMLKRFGKQYALYMKRTPGFIPRIS